MVYTSIILFFGFAMFMCSQLGGTIAMGVLVSFTLLVAMLSNLVLLPSLLLSLERLITTKSFSEPFLEILDEEEDIELDELIIQRADEYRGIEKENRLGEQSEYEEEEKPL